MRAYDTKLRVHTRPSCRAHCRDRTTLYGGGGGSTSEPDKRRLVNQRARRPGPDRARTGPHASRVEHNIASSYLGCCRRHELRDIIYLYYYYYYLLLSCPYFATAANIVTFRPYHLILLYCYALTPVQYTLHWVSEFGGVRREDNR